MNVSRLIATFALAALTVSAPAVAAGKKLTLGVYLPTTIADGQERFQFSEQLGAALGKALDQPVAVKNFGRYEDFAAAAKNGIDVAVVDGWAAAELGLKGEVVGAAVLDGEASPRWAVVTREKMNVRELAGKRLAVPKGAKSQEGALVSRGIFVGDLDADKHFQLVAVPNVESALRLLESKGVEAALVPLRHVPQGMHVAYRSPRLPGALMVSLKADAKELQQVVESLPAVAPVEKFRRVEDGEWNAFRTLLTKGPPARIPAIAESPVVHADPFVLADVREVGLVLPDFAEFVEVGTELPDD